MSKKLINKDLIDKIDSGLHNKQAVFDSTKPSKPQPNTPKDDKGASTNNEKISALNAVKKTTPLLRKGVGLKSKPTPVKKQLNKKVRTGRGLGDSVLASKRIEDIRLLVKDHGRLVVYCRFRKEEKKLLQKIANRYKESDFDVPENKIVRIGTNWLLLDYKENKRKSILHKVIKALKA